MRYFSNIKAWLIGWPAPVEHEGLRAEVSTADYWCADSGVVSMGLNNKKVRHCG